MGDKYKLAHFVHTIFDNCSNSKVQEFMVPFLPESQTESGIIFPPAYRYYS